MYSGFTTGPLSDRSMQGVFILCGVITGRCFLSLISARVPSLSIRYARDSFVIWLVLIFQTYLAAALICLSLQWPRRYYEVWAQNWSVFRRFPLTLSTYVYNRVPFV